VPAIIRWPGRIKPGTVENVIFSGLDWLPTLANAAGNSDIKVQLLKGVQLGDRTYKNHLDGYDQMDLCWATRRPLAMRSSISAARSWVPFGLMISNSSSTNSRRAGQGKGSRLTCRR
jgi:hypothetical protein